MKLFFRQCYFRSSNSASLTQNSQNKAKRHCTICGSKKHDRRQCDQEPDAESNPESVNEDHSNESLSDTESAWNGFSDDDEKQRSSPRQGTKH